MFMLVSLLLPLLTLLRRCKPLLVTLLRGSLVWVAASSALAHPSWPAVLVGEVAKIDKQSQSGIGVYVQDLDTGLSASYQADQR